MKNIVLTRIDDRLIHGQVVMAWVRQTKGNRIVIVDDPLSRDAFMQKVFRAAAPPSIRVEILATAAARELLAGEPERGERVIVLVKAPCTIEELMNGGIALGPVILGGMGSNRSRTKFYKDISASEEEVGCIRRILQKGGSMQYQRVPDECPVDVGTILKGAS